jgi:hypothetical protein
LVYLIIEDFMTVIIASCRIVRFIQEQILEGTNFLIIQIFWNFVKWFWPGSLYIHRIEWFRHLCKLDWNIFKYHTFRHSRMNIIMWCRITCWKCSGIYTWNIIYIQFSVFGNNWAITNYSIIFILIYSIIYWFIRANWYISCTFAFKTLTLSGYKFN